MITRIMRPLWEYFQFCYRIESNIYWTQQLMLLCFVSKYLVYMLEPNDLRALINMLQNKFYKKMILNQFIFSVENLHFCNIITGWINSELCTGVTNIFNSSLKRLQYCGLQASLESLDICSEHYSIDNSNRWQMNNLINWKNTDDIFF